MSRDSKISALLVIMDSTLIALSLSSSGVSKVSLIPSHPTPGPDSVALYFSALHFKYPRKPLSSPPFPAPLSSLCSLDPSSSVCFHIYRPQSRADFALFYLGPLNSRTLPLHFPIHPPPPSHFAWSTFFFIIGSHSLFFLFSCLKWIMQ